MVKANIYIVLVHTCLHSWLTSNTPLKQHIHPLIFEVFELLVRNGFGENISHHILGRAVHSVATVVTDAFQKRFNYDAKEISQNHENICGDKTHQKPRGHILSQKNWTAISHATERS
jgi:hypothetical protein